MTLTSARSSTRDLSKRPVWLIFWFSAALYGIPSIWLLQNYLQPAFDLAIYDQTLWLISQGEWFNTIIGAHVFGAHFSPILIALAPLSFIPGGSIPELVTQSLLIASGVFPAARMAGHLNRSPLSFAVIYAIHPAIVGGSWYGFRPWNLAVPVFMWAVSWVLEEPNQNRILITGFLLLLFREDLATWIGLLAIILALAGRLDWKTLVVPGVILAASTGLILFGVLPALSPVADYFFASGSETRIPRLGVATVSVSVRLLFLLVPLAVRPRHIDWKLAMPLAVPVAGLLLKGGNALTTLFHYDMMFVPLLLLVVGLSPTPDYHRVRGRVFASLLILFSLGALRPIPPQQSTNPFRYDSSLTQQMDRAASAIRSIDGAEQLSLTAPSSLVPHFSERSTVFLFPSPVTGHPTPRDAYQLVDIVDYQCQDPNIVVSEQSRLGPTWSELLTMSYHLIAEHGSVSVWLRAERADPRPCKAVWHDPPS